MLDFFEGGVAAGAVAGVLFLFAFGDEGRDVGGEVVFYACGEAAVVHGVL